MNLKMKIAHSVLIMLLIVIPGCKSDDRMLPVDVWSEGCKQLSRSGDGYKLEGLCCADLVIPKLKLGKNGRFATNGIFSTFTGAGDQNSSVKVSGSLSEDGKILKLGFSTEPAFSQEFTFGQGAADKICQCFCD